jgi:hypothetical protein
MRPFATGLLLALSILFMVSGNASGRELTKKQWVEVNRFAANNSLFVLYHEVGHLLVHQLDLPVLGREEDAADNMATWTLLNKHTPEADQALADAAHGWLLSGLTYNSNPDDSDYYASHSLDRQRAFQIVCLMVGSDDTAFKPIANEYAIDSGRQDSCHWDYQLTDRSLNQVLGVRGNKTHKGVEVHVTYHDATGELKRAADAFRESGVFDQVADELRDNYHLADPVMFNAKRCGEANAFYDPNTLEIIFCYEMMQDFIDLYVKSLPKKGVSQVPGATGLGRRGTAGS